MTPDGATVERIAATLLDAERPVLLAGVGAVDVREELVALAGSCGALLATSLRAKGLFDGEPGDVGIAGAFSTNAAERCSQRPTSCSQWAPVSTSSRPRAAICFPRRE